MRSKTLRAAVCAAAFSAGHAAISAQEPEPALQADLSTVNTLELNKQLMKEHTSDTDIGVALWLPLEYWIAYETAGGGGSERVVNGLTRDMSGLEIFLVAACDIGVIQEGDQPLQELTWHSNEQITHSIRLTAPDGSTAKPLSTEAVPATLRAYIDNSVPYLTAGFGLLGEQMSVVYFENKKTDDKPAISPLAQGQMKMFINGDELRWRLPIGGLLVPRSCEECAEHFAGNFNYCPYDGSALKNLAPKPNP